MRDIATLREVWRCGWDTISPITLIIPTYQLLFASSGNAGISHSRRGFAIIFIFRSVETARKIQELHQSLDYHANFGLVARSGLDFCCLGSSPRIFASFERFTGWPEKLGQSAVAKIIAWVLVSLAWYLWPGYFFRAESIDQAWEILKAMFSFQGSMSLGWGLDATIFILMMILRELFAAFHFDDKLKGKHPILEMLFYAILIATIIFFRGEGSKFIYFQF